MAGLKCLTKRATCRNRVPYFNSAIEVAEDISSMVVSGAPIIGCTCAYGIALEAQRLRNATSGGTHQSYG